jgi:hypothetical protein
MRISKILALILIVGGVALLAYGAFQFIEFRDSLGGRAAAMGNRVARSFGGSNRVAQGYVQPIIMMVSGAVAGIAGFFIFKKS